MQHYFLSQTIKVGDQIQLPDDVSHHLSRVLRAEVGDQIEVVSSEQLVFQAEVSQLVRQKVTVSVTKQLPVNVELPVKATIVSGLSKGNKPELIVQKATELGASQIIFLPMKWSIVKWDQKSVKKIKRLNEVALSSAEQSHRNVVPTVSYLKSLKALVAMNFDTKLVAYEESAKVGEKAELLKQVEATPVGHSIVAVFGPEGGIAPEEIQLLNQNGFTNVGLGPRIMRTETAPLYFLTAVSVLTELQGS